MNIKEMYRETIEEKLLLLIRQGLGIDGACSDAVNAKSLVLSSGEWVEVFNLAKEQAVVGLLVSAVERIPKEARPPKPMLMQMIAVSEQIRWQNEKVDAVLVELVRLWRGMGIEPIVVKGQIIAREYVMPERRASGDIDVFFIAQHWPLVEQWVAQNNIPFRRTAAEKHIELTVQGVQVELHYHLNTFSSTRANRYWKENIEKKAIENSRTVEIKPTSGCPTVADKDAIQIRTLGTTETLLHLLVHVHHHLLNEGVGLRQLIDMKLFLDNHVAPLHLPMSGLRDGEADYPLLKKHLQGIGHTKAFAAYCALMNKYLDLPKEKLPFELDIQDYVYAERIMHEVWCGGNFGHKYNLRGVKPGLLHSLNTARLVIRHSIRFLRLAPAEARGYWWNKIFWRMMRK